MTNQIGAEMWESLTQTFSPAQLTNIVCSSLLRCQQSAQDASPRSVSSRLCVVEISVETPNTNKHVEVVVHDACACVMRTLVWPARLRASFLAFVFA